MHSTHFLFTVTVMKVGVAVIEIMCFVTRYYFAVYSYVR